MDGLIEQHLGNPVLLAVLLFLGPYILEEAAIFAGAALAAAGELPVPVVLAVLGAGMVSSDWLLFALGAIAGRNERLRRWIGEETIARGSLLLGRGALAAAISARLVPWLLLPIFVASGFLGVGFVRFAAINLAVSVAYIGVMFFGVYGINLVLFDLLQQWGWAVAGLTVVLLVWLSRRLARRYRAGGPGSSGE